MRKGFFLSVPSVSVDKTLNPVADELCRAGYEIIRYNTPEFGPTGAGVSASACRFKPYPSSYRGFETTRLSRSTSYFELAEMLLDTATTLREFLKQEAETERPDFVLHSHLAPWGKALAGWYGMPAVSLFSTFILDARIMKPAFRMQKQEGRAIAGDISQFVRCQRKYRALYDTTNGWNGANGPNGPNGSNGSNGRRHPDIWDAYVNEEGLNISFILEAFQERADDFRPPKYRFVGHPTRATPRDGAARTLIYLALGTILNDDEELFRVSARAFARLTHPCLIALGKVKPEALGPLPAHVRTAAFVDQETVLGDAAIFITMGGMASVHEAVSAMVPMIVIPETPEQLITARKIEALGIGVHVPREQVTDARLLESVERILRDQRTYRDRLRALTAGRQPVPPARLARSYIAEYLESGSSMPPVA